MKLSAYFQKQHILADLAAATKRDAIKEMVQVLCDHGGVDPAEANGILRAVMRREDLGTTGIGKGMAVPHAKHAGVKGVIGALGLSRQGVEFDALDGQPVQLIFLIISAPDAVAAHLEALKKITALLRDQDFCTFFKRAKDLSELIELLDEAEERLAKL